MFDSSTCIFDVCLKPSYLFHTNYSHSLQVFVDAANTGEWDACVNLEDIKLPDYWANRAYIGMTATTGALADNHDILSIKTYSDQAVMEQEEQQEKVAKPANFVLPAGESLENKVAL